jgi:hypothetical protein
VTLGRPAAFALSVAIAVAAASGHAANTKSAPLAPLPFLPSVSRVRLTTYGKMLSVTTEANLPRGDWAGEPLQFHVAFGAPGPRAIDAHLVPIGDGELEAEEEEKGETLQTERVPRRPSNAHPLLGQGTMAGIVVHLPAAVLTKAFARGNMAALRIRSLVEPTEDATGALSAVVRLGASRGTPLTLGRITATAPEGANLRAEAKLCGPEADAEALAVEAIPKSGERRNGIAPVLAVRHASDDLCVRLWLGPTKGAR